MHQMGSTQRLGLNRITVLERRHQCAMLTLILEPTFGHGAAALERAPLRFRTRLVYQTENAVDERIACSCGNHFVHPSARRPPACWRPQPCYNTRPCAQSRPILRVYPGDIIATGTPAGVGMGFNPPRYLQSGDVVRIEIEGLGVIENRFS